MPIDEVSSQTVDDNPKDRSTFPLARQCPFSPPEEYSDWRGSDPVKSVETAGGRKAWVLTRYEDVREMLASNSVTRKPALTELRSGPTEESLGTSLLHMDEPEHGAFRRMLAREFTSKGLAPMRPRIEAIVNGCVDDMISSGSPVDLVSMFCLPIPSTVICELLGVPYEDHHYFEELSRQITDLRASAEDFAATNAELQDYMERIVTEKERQPSDDLLGRLIQSRVTTGEMSHGQLVGLSRLLLIAGHETTATQIAMGVLNICTNPDARARLAADPELWPNAVEEILRIDSISDNIPVRTALEEIEISGTTIRPGDGVIPLLGGANHDPDFFEDPETFDIFRKPSSSKRAHVGFGSGIHACLGQTLARMELEIALRTLFERIPDIRLEGGLDRVDFNTEAMVYGPNSVRVEW